MSRIGFQKMRIVTHPRHRIPGGILKTCESSDSGTRIAEWRKVTHECRHLLSTSLYILWHSSRRLAREKSFAVCKRDYWWAAWNVRQWWTTQLHIVTAWRSLLYFEPNAWWWQL